MNDWSEEEEEEEERDSDSDFASDSSSSGVAEDESSAAASALITSVTILCPLKLYPNVSFPGSASPIHPSDEQYGTKTRFMPASGLTFTSLSKIPVFETERA